MSTVARVAAMLGCLDEMGEIAVTSVAARLGLPKSTTLRLMADMASTGVLARVGGTRRYRPGPLLSGIVARQPGAAHDLAETGALALRPLVERFGHTGFVMGLEGADAVVLRVLPGTLAIRVHVPGHLSDGPAFCRSPGRALLARLPDDAVRARHSTELQPQSPQAPQSMPDLLRRLALTRRRGYAEAYDEGVPGVGGIAVAAGPSRERSIGLSLAFPTALVRSAERRLIALAMLEARGALGRKLGDPVQGR